jgi:hypothetical protein
MVGLILDYFKVCMRDSLPLLRLRLGKNGFLLLPWQIPDLPFLLEFHQEEGRAAQVCGSKPSPALGVLGYLKGRVEGG